MFMFTLSVVWIVPSEYLLFSSLMKCLKKKKGLNENERYVLVNRQCTAVRDRWIDRKFRVKINDRHTHTHSCWEGKNWAPDWQRTKVVEGRVSFFFSLVFQCSLAETRTEPSLFFVVFLLIKSINCVFKMDSAEFTHIHTWSNGVDFNFVLSKQMIFVRQMATCANGITPNFTSTQGIWHWKFMAALFCKSHFSHSKQAIPSGNGG